MVARGRLLILVLSVIGLTCLAILYFDEYNPFNKTLRGDYKVGVSDEMDSAVGKAQKVYKDRKAIGIDFATGPCLTNDLMPNWVADIVHNPRQKIDDLAENQCPAFSEGRANHFVELGLEGEVVRVK